MRGCEGVGGGVRGYEGYKGYEGVLLPYTIITKQKMEGTYFAELSCTDSGSFDAVFFFCCMA